MTTTVIHFRSLIFAALAACAISITAQVADTTTLPVFRSMQEALRQPELVLSLDLSDQHLGSLPSDVFRFTNLRELRVRNDDLNSLPPEIASLTHLRLLDMSGNPITLLPERFAELGELEELYLNNDKSLALERDLGILARLPHLRILHLENDGLSTLPANIGDMRWLEELYLNDNDLNSVPAGILRLENLEFLDMHANPIDPLRPLDPQQRGVLIRF